MGSTVYSDANLAIGEVDDLIVDSSGKITDAVISVGGFLGIDAKLVKVPYGELRFDKSTKTVTTTERTTDTVVAGTGAGKPATVTTTNCAQPALAGAAMAHVDNAAAVQNGLGGSNTQAVTIRIVLPGVSKDQLSSMPKFSYS